MARNSSPTTPDNNAESRSRAAVARNEDDAPDFEAPELLDLETEEESPFLRAQKRVPVRRGPLPKKTANRLKWVLLAGFAAVVLLSAGLVLYRYGARSWRFRIDSGDNIAVSGLHHVTRAQIMDVMGGDIGRNVFFVPLSDRKKALEEIPWVQSAVVMRFLPNRLTVAVQERTPVAFVQVGSKISLIDATGVIMDLPAGSAKQYSFPVIVGMSDAEPLSTRSARMKIYRTLIAQLDSEGHYSQDLSEVELSDPEDVKVTVADPAGEVLIHLGSSNFLERYKVYVTHAQEWRQQFQKLSSVDLRYDAQAIVNPDSGDAALPAKNARPAARKK